MPACMLRSLTANNREIRTKIYNYSLHYNVVIFHRTLIKYTSQANSYEISILVEFCETSIPHQYMKFFSYMYEDSHNKDKMTVRLSHLYYNHPLTGKTSLYSAGPQNPFYNQNVSLPSFNTLRPRQNGLHFANDIFIRIFFNKNVWISIKISLKFVPEGLIINIPALVQIMAWRRQGDKPLSEAMMVNLPTHICVSRPQWVKQYRDITNRVITVHDCIRKRRH